MLKKIIIKIIAKILKFLIPHKKYMKLRSFLLGKKRFPSSIKNVYGFDIYQNNNDIDYSEHIGSSLNSIQRSRDSDVLIFSKYFLEIGDIAIDIGANIGLMSLAMSKFVGPSGAVVSIEPGPVSFALLRVNKYKNFNTAKNIILVDAACTDVDGDVPLFINSNGESDNQVHKGHTSYVFRNELSRECHIAQGISLDKKLSDLCNLDKVTFVKIDTQGHEWYVLNGAKKIFSEKKSLAILCEYAPYLKSWQSLSTEKFYDLIIDMGFTIYDIRNISHGRIDFSYLTENYDFNKVSNYTDLLLLKGDQLTKFEADKNMLNNFS
jgi:FkbM family methyltransferase